MKYYVWLMPESREILVADNSEIPLFSTNLCKSYQDIVNNLGGNKVFDDFNKAMEYAKPISEKMNWYLSIDNENIRYIRSCSQQTELKNLVS